MTKHILIVFKSFIILFLFLGVSYGESVKVSKSNGEWTLTVGEHRFDLKGVGCSRLHWKSGVNYLEIAKEMGANTVRTWGKEHGNDDYFSMAKKLGLKVNAGIWLPHGNSHKGKKIFSYLKNKKQLEEIEKEIIAYVKRYKSHPSLLMWNLGNEVIHFTKDEDERIAFSQFLGSLIGQIKKVDPYHPIIYAFAGHKNFRYAQKYFNQIDIIGVNTYGSIDSIEREMNKLSINKPFIVTESGPIGPWDVKRDTFGFRVDHADYEKSFRYQYHLEEWRRLKGKCLGIFPFRLGDPKGKKLFWWNITIGRKKRDSFRVVYEAFNERKMKNVPPFCISIDLAKETFSPDEKITIHIKARDNDKDKLLYGIRFLSIAQLKNKQHLPEVNVPDKQNSEPTFHENAPSQKGLYKLIAYVDDQKGNVSVRDRTIQIK